LRTVENEVGGHAAMLPSAAMASIADEVDYVSGKTRVFGIVGHPIEQVRSPEIITAELIRRGHDAVLVPMHVLPDDFDDVVPRILRLQNLGGLVFTIPYKARAAALARELGRQARTLGVINALGRMPDGRWRGDIFDGLGCVEAFRRRGIPLSGKRVMLIGAGGAGSAIAAAVATEQPASLAIYDVDSARAGALATKVGATTASAATIEGVDVLMNATPVGMLDDARLPVAVDAMPRELTVFDAIVKPERTPLLALAQACGCVTVGGREMMLGQIARMVDFFYGA
jgi:shikimate dehydrogenase